MKKESLEFLKNLLAAHGTSGYEGSVRQVWRARIEKYADEVFTDAMGSCIAVLNPKGSPKVMLAGHIDEIGFQVTHIDDLGFLYIANIGGHDVSLVPGRRVLVHTRGGDIPGVTGKKAIHLMTPEERKKIPEIHELWIDIGARDKAEALQAVEIGDSVTHDIGFQELRNGLVTSRALDDRTGAYVAAETLIELAKSKTAPKACVVAVATSQEEIGTRGAITSAYRVDPDVGICIDVTHASDSPDIDPRKTGVVKLGGGPRLTRGASVNPKVFDALADAAKKGKIPYQVGAVPAQAPNDTRSLQIAREGVATGTVGLPLRYMHTPSEVMSLADLDYSVDLLAKFCHSLKPKDRFELEP
jgi:endoglucanase